MDQTAARESAEWSRRGGWLGLGWLSENQWGNYMDEKKARSVIGIF